MKKLKPLIVGVLLAAFCAAPFAAFAADQKEKPKLKPYVYEYEGREIKFCCKGCVKDFKKEPAKYIKKIEEAEAKAKKAKSDG